MARKSEAEARFERMTWYILVVILLLMYFDRNLIMPEWFIPLGIAMVLVVSSLYQQFVRKFQPSLIAWGVAITLMITGVYVIYYNELPFIDPRLISIVGVVIVILAGVITNEG